MASDLFSGTEDETKSDDVRTFLIPSPNMPKFTERFDKLVKRAKRIGCEIPTFHVVKEEPLTIQVVVDEVEDEFGRSRPVYQDRVILMRHVVISNPKVVVAGHEFVCTIEHTEEGNLLHTLSGKSVPLKYRTCQPWCDHCKTLRRRNDTFVVQNISTGVYLQIGRNCLADYLGRDAEQYAASAEIYFEVDELGLASESMGEGGWGGGGERFDYLDAYLGFVAECIARDGWRSRTTAKEYGGKATADSALRIMHPSKEDIRDNLLPWRTPSEKSVEMGKLAMTWCEALSDEEVEASEYLHNIRLISRRGVVGGRSYGYAASIVSGYQKHIGELKRKARFAEQALVSNHVGTVGERSKFLLTIEHVVSLPDFGFGESSLHLMSDQEGNRFTWKSGTTTLEKGEEVLLKGTIKAHEEYKGVKQTKLSRCEKLELKTYTLTLEAKTLEVSAEDEKVARKMLLSMFGLTRMPKGGMIQQKVSEQKAEEV